MDDKLFEKMWANTHQPPSGTTLEKAARYYFEKGLTAQKNAMADVGLSDSDLLDFLEMQNEKGRYTGLCIYRESTTGRGWRLHETSNKRAYGSVRQAIRAAIEESR